MDPLIETLLWLLVLLPTILLVIGFLLYLLLRNWQEKTKEDLKQIRARLRGLQSESLKIRQEGKDYTPDDPAPFGPLAEDMLRKLAEGDQQTAQLHKDYAYLQENVRNLDIQRLREKKDPVSFIRLPYDWYYIRQYISALNQDLENTQNQYKNAQAYLGRMQSQGWEVARLARQVMEDDQNALRILGRLRSANLRDPILEAAMQEAQDCEQTLHSQVPVYFMSGDEKTVTGQADKTTVTGVYHIIDQARLSVHDTLKNALSWERRFKALEQALQDLAERFRPLSENISKLESVPIHPINWDQTRGKLASFRQQIEALGKINQARKLEQMDKDLENAKRLLQELDETSSHVQKMGAGHKEMVDLVEQPDVKQGQEWVRQAKRVADQAAAYDPENWPRTAGVQSLGEDLKTLNEQHSHLDIKETGATVAESELEIALDEARELFRMHQELRPRLNAIQVRLVEIQETERNTRDTLARTRALLNQAVSLIGSNTPLASGASKEAEELRAELEELTNVIEQRARGPVDKKAQQASALIRKIEQAGNRWLETLEESVDKIKESLAEKAGVLRQIAFLDEPAVLEAEQLLEIEFREEAPEPKRSSLLAGLPFTNGKGTKKRRQREQLPFSEVVKELKHKNEEWQRCIAVTRAIEDMEGPIIEEYNRAEAQATSTREVLIQAMDMIPAERGWPPTTLFINNEHRAFEGLEKRWDTLRNERLRALQLVGRLSELAGAYQDLEGKIVQIAERARQEQDRVSELEQRLGESMRMWQGQLQAYGNNLYLKDEIEMLLEEAAQEVQDIRQKYLRGTLPYNQVVQNLRSLCQRVESAQATVDADQVIDINGVVQRRSH
jgi:hypothetical protein